MCLCSTLNPANSNAGSDTSDAQAGDGESGSTAASDRAALKELAPTCADRGHWGIMMCRFLWGVAALEVYLGLYRLARLVGAGSDKAARHC